MRLIVCYVFSKSVIDHVSFVLLMTTLSEWQICAEILRNQKQFML